MTGDEIALLFTRWYSGCEKEVNIIRENGITVKWFSDNVRAENFSDFVVDMFVMPHGSIFMAVQKLFSFIFSKLCGKGDFDDEDRVFADLTIELDSAFMT